MNAKTYPCMIAILAALSPTLAADISLESAPPVVVKTEPVAGATRVDPQTSEIVVQFSKAMQDGNWSWSTWGEENFPEMKGESKYAADKKTCILPVKLQPGKFYAIWLNSDKFKNFKDTAGRPAVPYLLTFSTTESTESSAAAGGAPPQPSPDLDKLNADQLAVLAWTDRQFRSFFDARTFDGWSDAERATLEAKLIDTRHRLRTRRQKQSRSLDGDSVFGLD